MDKQQRSDALIICLFAMASEEKGFSNGRLTELSNAILNEEATTNAVALRIRSYKAKARELLLAIENKTPIDGATLIGGPEGARVVKRVGPVKKAMDNVKTGRITKRKNLKALQLADLTTANLTTKSSCGNDAAVKEERVDDYLDGLNIDSHSQNQAEM